MDVFCNGSSLFEHQPQLCMKYFADNIQSHEALTVPSLGLTTDFTHDNRNGEEEAAAESFVSLCPPPGNNKSTIERKRRRKNERVVDKPKEVIHVRSKRGKAADSHSLAERTMGMAVMLDVIINYVHSLQNQIEGTNELCEAQDMDRMVRDGYGGPSYFHSTWSLLNSSL